MDKKNVDFFMNTNLNKYVGEWISIVDEKIITHGKDVKKVYNDTKLLYPKKKALVTMIPDKKTMILVN
ncbi:MAG: hypothetical protein HY831_04880 [Candidatus Aenigmarchaeota archaeon]|nr:hypothetical protein [Candidatus Aenigmarchaeota archaeon]